MQDQHFIGGTWRAAAEGGTDDVLAPATGAVLATVVSGTAADVDAVVEAIAPVVERARAARR